MDIRQLLQQIQDEQQQWTPERVARERRRYMAIGEAALSAAERAIQQSEGDTSEELPAPWHDPSSGGYNL